MRALTRSVATARKTHTPVVHWLYIGQSSKIMTIKTNNGEIKASLPASSEFLKFHERLNHFVKISTAAIDHLSDFHPDKAILSQKISDLIVDAGERWTATGFGDAHAELGELRQHLSEAAIVRVYASIESFVGRINGSYDSFQSAGATPKIEVNNLDILTKLYERFGWSTASVAGAITMAQVYHIIRNCIAHEMGRANKEVRDMLTSPDLNKVHADWQTVTGNNLSPLPSVTEDGSILLRPHHAITYSDACLRVVRDVNRNLIAAIGINGLVRQAAEQVLLRPTEVDVTSFKSPYTLINAMLRETYGLKDVGWLEVKSILEDEGLRTECLNRFNKFKNRTIT